MRISDWSSDVCSSDLRDRRTHARAHSTSRDIPPGIRVAARQGADSAGSRAAARFRAAGCQFPCVCDRRGGMSNAMPASREPLALYAIGLGSNRRHARHGDPRAVLLAALAALESDDIEADDASPIIASDTSEE